MVVLRIFPNGGGDVPLAVVSMDDPSNLFAAAVADALLGAYPHAARVGAWHGSGVELAHAVAPCLDKSSSCVEWAAADECTQNPSYMRTECKKSCGSCGDTERRAASSLARLHGQLVRTEMPVLFAVVDHYPFVWPHSVGSIMVHVEARSAPVETRAPRLARTYSPPQSISAPSPSASIPRRWRYVR